MLIDARGLRHPDHIKKFKEILQDYCTVHENIEVLLDDRNDDLKKFEMYIRSLRCVYEKDIVDDHVMVSIEGPFSMCG